MSIREYGFEPIEDLEPRIVAFLDSLTDEQREQFRQLSEAQEVYYQDAKRFIQGVVADEWQNKSVSVAQRQVNVSLATTNVLLRAMTKFMLAAGEIVSTGKTGEIRPETDRVLKLN